MVKRRSLNFCCYDGASTSANKRKSALSPLDPYHLDWEEEEEEQGGNSDKEVCNTF